jgi:hypothetical protein
MLSTLEVMVCALVFRPVHAVAIVVFLYQAAAAMVRETRGARRLGDAPRLLADPRAGGLSGTAWTNR